MLVDTYMSEIKGKIIKIDVLNFGESTFMDVFVDGVFDERLTIPPIKSNDNVFISSMAYNVFKIKECKL